MKKLMLLPVVILFFSCSEGVEAPKSEAALSNAIDYQDKVNNKIYYESDSYKMILFAMKKDQVLKPHSAPMDTPVLILEGQVKITIDNAEHILSSGESIVLPKDIDHGVYPITDVKFVLIK